MRMATLKDISRRLNLSVTQVSRALNGHADVKEETRQRVMDAAKALNYHPNLTARKLVSGRSGVVGFVMTRYSRLASDGFLLETFAGLSQQFSERDMQFVLHIAQEGDRIVEVYRKLNEAGSLDGFVVTEPVRNDPRIAYLTESGTPFVVHGRTSAQARYPYFDIDNHRVAYRSARHLVERGHRHIALINGLAHFSFAIERLEGYRAALAEAGLSYRPDLVRHDRMTEALGLVSTVQFFSGEAPFPTGILCGNTLIAKGVYKALEMLGRRVPQDVSVIAHDDVLPDAASPFFRPDLTLTRSSIQDSWAPLAEFLAGAIAGKPVQTQQRVADFDFVEGQSVASIPS
jgi:LacI family transcriptional regulator